MKMQIKHFTLLSTFASLVIPGGAALLETNSSPIVTLPYGSFRGQVQGTTAKFLGMPFAAPPTGKRRFGLPEPPAPLNQIRDATAFGAPCPQQAVQVPKDSPFQFPPHAKNMSEDCLFINVFRPANVSAQNLPVLFYFYGGGFQVGDTSLYPGNTLVTRSLALGEPVVYVSANYRVNAFGFLAGKEVKEKGLTNIGLHDQRFALKWVQENIAIFGGDPTKVTIWGESAGAFSVSLHLIFDEGNTGGLFSAAIMESGAPIRLPDVLDQQIQFDRLVTLTNCTDAPDRFLCLQEAPYAALQSAVDASPSMFSYQSLALSWLPVIDGTLISRNPMQLVESGKYAKVPFIIGDNEDQGTLFAQNSLNVTTNSSFIEYMKTNYFTYITDDQMEALAIAYPADFTQGSPFGTGTANAITPEYKRIAALQGDMVFQAPRRFLLKVASKTQPAYSYRYLRDATLAPTYGAFHGIEMLYFFSFVANQTDYIATDAILYFANRHDPNPPSDSISLLRNTHWPKWSETPSAPPLLTFFDPLPSVNITSDIYRSEAINLMIQLRKQ